MKVSAFGPRSVAAALAALWFLAHLPFLAPSLEDIDSINFALGLRYFDPALHQPHPPGYPVYIALGRVSRALIDGVAPAMSPVRAEALALAVWSALCGALAIVAAARLFAAVERRGADNVEASRPLALWGTALMAVAPLFWMSGLRPMSDMVGLAGVLWAQALVVEGHDDRRRLMAGALVAGLAGGIRVQTLALTLPLLLYVCIEAKAWRPILAFVVGVIAWAIPLVAATGGIAAYRQALGVQAAEDFGWVDMVLSNPTPRRVAFSLYETFVLPWASLQLAAVIALIASAGLAVLLMRHRRPLVVMLIAFVPYIPYHLLLQETITVRYALPIVPLIAWLGVHGLMLARRWMPLLAVPVVGSALIVAAAGGIAYGREPHPAFRAIGDADRRAEMMPPAASYSHYGLRRPLQAAGSPALRAVEPRRNHEWLGLTEYWRDGGTGTVWFFADPRRTDLALIDPYARRDVVRYRWAAEDRAELSGTRPLGVDWYRLMAPGWFAGEGWSLTPEAGGITRASSAGPDHRPIEAWVRRRAEPMHMVIGGRHLGDAGAPAGEFELMIDGVLIDRWRLTSVEQNFLRFVDLPEGVTAAAAGGAGGYAHLSIASRTADGDPRRAEVAIRQFDVQSSTRVVFGFGEGWHEEEYAPQTGLRWRWTSERSVLRLKGRAQPIRLTLRGESPLKYVDTAPRVKVITDGHVIGEFTPADDFEWSVVVPAAWAASDGAIAIETDRIYFPGPAEGTSDARHLGLRLYEVRVDPVEP